MWAIRIRGSILSLSEWGCTHRFFPYWLRLFFCVFVKDQLFPFWDLSVCTFVKYQLLPFWGLAVCTSQISTPSFLDEIMRCSSVPLCHNHILYMSHHWAGMYMAKRGRNIFGHHTYWALCVVLEKRWKAGTPVTGPQRMCLILGRSDLDHFCLIGPGCTHFCLIHQQ